MSLAFNEPANTVVSILFDRMVLSLQGNNAYSVTSSIALAGHFPLVLPDEFPLAGYLLIARGLVMKTHDASALLTVSIGERAITQEWPTMGKVVEVNGGKAEPLTISSK